MVPAAPLLVPAVAGGSAGADAALRGRCLRAVGAIAGADEVVVVGDAPTTGERAGGWDFTGLGVAAASGRPALPLALAVGDWFLDQAGWPGRRRFVGVAVDEFPAACAALGAELVTGRHRVALLAVADGTACRTEKAPGHLDGRAAGFDAAVAAALAAGDPAGLLGVDSALARELLAAGRASWQVLAGAARAASGARLEGGARCAATHAHAEAPYGVGYFVAVWRPA